MMDKTLYIRSIQIIYEEYDKLRHEYESNKRNIAILKADNLQCEPNRIIRYKINRFNDQSSVQFKDNEYWLKTMYEFYSNQKNLFQQNIQIQYNILENLNKKVKIKHNPPTSTDKLIDPCQFCCKSVLLCDNHTNSPQHQPLFIHERCTDLPEDSVLSISVEYLNNVLRPTGDHLIRIAIMASIIVPKQRQSNYLLIYHSFLKPICDLEPDQVILGLNQTELKEKGHKFVNHDQAIDALRHVAANRLVVYNSEEISKEIIEYFKVPKRYDINTFYTTSATRTNQNPVSTQWLSNYVLRNNKSNISEDLIIRARETLRLFNKIPKKSKQKYLETITPTKSQKPKTIKSVVELFTEEFTPDFEI